MDLETKAKEMLTGNSVCYLATASQEREPEVAPVNYVSLGHTLYFETMTRYDKYANLRLNKRVSVAITDKPYVLQIKGDAVQLEGEEKLDAEAMLIATLGKRPVFYDDPDIRFFKITPTRVKITDCSQNPIQPIELRIF